MSSSFYERDDKSPQWLLDFLHNNIKCDMKCMICQFVIALLVTWKVFTFDRFFSETFFRFKINYTSLFLLPLLRWNWKRKRWWSKHICDTPDLSEHYKKKFKLLLVRNLLAWSCVNYYMCRQCYKRQTFICFYSVVCKNSLNHFNKKIKLRNFLNKFALSLLRAQLTILFS